MQNLSWGAVTDRKAEQGVDHGVVYFPDVDGDYNDAHPWNGLTSVTKSPSGAEATPQYADNGVYIVLTSKELFAATVECLNYPPAFDRALGEKEIAPGIVVGQQAREGFSFAYRTQVLSAANPALGEKIEIFYGCQAAPSEKAANTINDSPELSTFSFDFSTTPINIDYTGFQASATMTIDSTEVEAGVYETLLDILYGRDGEDARVPTPDEVQALVGGGAPTDVNMADDDNQPTYNDTTHVVTLPAVTGVVWEINGEVAANGAQPALAFGETANIEATPAAGYNIVGSSDFSFSY